MIVPAPSGEVLASLVALTFLEIVLGLDNLLVLTLAVQRLAPGERGRGRWIGQSLAMGIRLAMLAAVAWASRLDIVLVAVLGRPVTVKDVVLIAGGLFLIAKGTTEIQASLEGDGRSAAGAAPRPHAAMAPVVAQIVLLNIVFSIDSVVTAVGMTSDLRVMAAAVVASTLVMLFAAKWAGEFIHAHPTLKMLALAFVLLVGVALVADGIGFHIPRGYVYFAIGFSLFVETLNAAYRRLRGRSGPPID